MLSDGFGRQRLPGALVLARLGQFGVVAVQVIRTDVLQLQGTDFSVDAGEQVAVAGYGLGFHTALDFHFECILGVLLEGVPLYRDIAQFAVLLKQGRLPDQFLFNLPLGHARSGFPSHHVVLEPLAGGIPASKDADLVGYDVAAFVGAWGDVCHVVISFQEIPQPHGGRTGGQ